MASVIMTASILKGVTSVTVTSVIIWEVTIRRATVSLCHVWAVFLLYKAALFEEVCELICTLL